MNEIYLEGRGGLHEGIRSDTLLFCQGKEKKQTNRQTKKNRPDIKKHRLLPWRGQERPGMETGEGGG